MPQHPWVPRFGASVRRAHIALFNCACPIVVALERYGINGGCGLALSADYLVAGELLRLQLAHEVVPDSDVLGRAEELAARLASMPDQSPRNIKSDMRMRLGIDLPCR